MGYNYINFLVPPSFPIVSICLPFFSLPWSLVFSINSFTPSSPSNLPFPVFLHCPAHFLLSLKTLQWILTTVNTAGRALMVWPLLISLTSSSISHCFTPSIPAIVAFFPFFQHRKVITTSGPLHLFLLPEGKYSFPRVSYGPGPHFTEASPQVSLRRFCLSTYLN